MVEVQAKKLDMEIKLGNLIEREIVITALESVGNVIQSNLVDLPRKQSGKIARKLKRLGMEKEIEKILSEPIAKAIQEVKISVEKAMSKRYLK
jgi:hypothetical protein